MICNIRQFGQVEQNALHIGKSTHFCNYVRAGVRSRVGGGLHEDEESRTAPAACTRSALARD